MVILYLGPSASALAVLRGLFMIIPPTKGAWPPPLVGGACCWEGGAVLGFLAISSGMARLEVSAERGFLFTGAGGGVAGVCQEA